MNVCQKFGVQTFTFDVCTVHTCTHSSSPSGSNHNKWCNPTKNGIAMLYLCGFRICGFSLGARFRPVYYTFGTTGRMLTVGFRVLLWMQWNVTWLRGTVQPWWTGVGTPLWQWWERVGTGREPMGMKTKRSWVRMRSGRLKRDSLMRRVSLTRRDSLTRRALKNNREKRS